MIAYEIVDMFTDTPYGGCALGVVLDAAGLSTADMLAVARETALTETAFVVPPGLPGSTYGVRVMTPAGESPFGGHSAVGTASALVRAGRLAAGEAVQECGGRQLTVVAGADGSTVRVAGEPLALPQWDPGPLLAACGLTDADLTGAPQLAGFGPAFHVLPVDAQALARASADLSDPVWADCADAVLVAWDAANSTARVRVFAPGYGMPEDPACASAALGLGVWLAREKALSSTEGRHSYEVRQGEDLGRPATLSCTVDLVEGHARAATVHGRVTATASGRMAHPGRP
ncbi:phenazine biosynthesis-like protein [Streptomyces spiroverticillatus]|uniref:Phenazine biosynthesis-like protein n=1 Tax=Streptomyces finlayi TaxID=67296 RepID=A0A918X615_9ACTN|nr:PhzF family phenazine biosynthesis protein [Streptomyces finlayi]GHA30371.1 phenazine biosynthesis-like protein [Streptomyces spiroverticillatus]GHD14893.1 phenazine biosynthesis-like protein [Streptomyces finlayi]